MKAFSIGGDILRLPLLAKICASVLTALAFFYLGKHWSDGYQQLVFFTSNPQASAVVAVSPNLGKRFDPLSVGVSPENESRVVSPPPNQPPPPPSVQRLGIVDENGTMAEDFEVGDFDPEYVENWGNASGAKQIGVGDGGSDSRIVRVQHYPLCAVELREYIPCLDNVVAIGKLKSTERGERFERHCPDKDQGLKCLVPPPKNYKVPIPWPKSRDEVWFSNVPHTRLVDDKGGQNWITKGKDKFKFPGGGTQFIHGADKYIDQIGQMVPDIAFGNHTRVVLDVGCGVASFGAYLLSRNVIPLSVAPKDVHENQIQFALERGVPAMVAAFATRRLLYPSQAFDLIHCSRCRINWTRDGHNKKALFFQKSFSAPPAVFACPDKNTVSSETFRTFYHISDCALFLSHFDEDGILLLEVNRMLRAGGYFVWAAQPVYKHEEALEEQWKEMINLTTRICWELVKKGGYVAIWRKTFNNNCYFSREVDTKPPLCDPNDDPDNVWYVNLKACITRLPENGYGANVTTWPERLHTPPDRLQSIQMDAYISRRELFKAELKYWNEIIDGHIHILKWKKLRLRNVLDMKAGFGGFAAALIDRQINCWVLNVVPLNGPNTLPVIYDRGLIGLMHDWCEPLDTYPRTYDLLHAAGLFSAEQKRNRCNISSIMLEMDRILRPGGHVYIRDSLAVMDQLQEIATAMGWRVTLRETAEGPHASYRVLTCDKQFLTA